MAPGTLPNPEQLAQRIRIGERAAIACGLNLLDSTHSEARSRATELLASLSGECLRGRGHVIGVTGPPGVGKSTLVAAMIKTWRSGGATVAVIAVDPSSRMEAGGGALLGDRIRMKSHTADEGLFIRSVASRSHLGGLAREAWPMTTLLISCFDVVVIETVGVGQTEIDIAELSDTVCYVAQPASGDMIQYLKSGIMEIPDVIAVNKADLGAAAHQTAAEICRIGHRPERQADWDYPVCLISAAAGTGVGELMEHVARHQAFLLRSGQLEQLRSIRQGGWVKRLLKEEFGLFGVQLTGGDAAIGERLRASNLTPVGEYELMRKQILAQFNPGQ